MLFDIGGQVFQNLGMARVVRPVLWHIEVWEDHRLPVGVAAEGSVHLAIVRVVRIYPQASKAVPFLENNRLDSFSQEMSCGGYPTQPTTYDSHAPLAG